MSISEEKTNIVINNYFKTECSVDTTIREAFEKGFRLGIKKVKAQERQWIPCSERLPEDSDYYLVTTSYGDVEQMWFAHKKDYDITKSEWRETDSEDEVLAWMPLPEPYREDGEA